MATDPLHQFEINKLAPLEIAGIDASFTNASAWMVGVVAASSLFILWGMRRPRAVPGRWQSMVEMFYEFVANMVRDTVGTEGRQYFPFIFTLFLFILISNLAGMIPWGFTVTSHIAVTFALAILVFLGVTVLGFIKHGTGFLKLFVPSGAPVALLPLVVLIELISYLTRPITLSVRLFANMTAGHIMLKVFAGFVFSLGAAGGVLSAVSVLPFAFVIALIALEFLVAFLQAYVFAILTCIYLNDALHPGH